MKRFLLAILFLFLATPVGTQDQGPVFVRAPIIGSGAVGDFYRSSVADAGISQSSHIPSGLDGKPLFADAVVRVNSADLVKIPAELKPVLPAEAEATIKIRDPRLDAGEFIRGPQRISMLRWLRHAITRALSPPLAWAGILASDDFNRADNTDLGTSWDAGYTGRNNLQIVSNAVQATALGTESIESYNAVSLPANQWCQLTVVAVVPHASSTNLMCLLRAAAPPTETFYQFQIRAATSGHHTRINKIVAGAGTNLAGESAAPWAATDILYSQAKGTALTLKRNGSTALTAGDSAIASGRPGIDLFVADAGGALTDAIADGWSAGNFCSGSPLLLMGVGGC